MSTRKVIIANTDLSNSQPLPCHFCSWRSMCTCRYSWVTYVVAVIFLLVTALIQVKVTGRWWIRRCKGRWIQHLCSRAVGKTNTACTPTHLLTSFSTTEERMHLSHRTGMPCHSILSAAHWPSFTDSKEARKIVGKLTVKIPAGRVGKTL